LSLNSDNLLRTYRFESESDESKLEFSRVGLFHYKSGIFGDIHMPRHRPIKCNTHTNGF